MLRDIEFTEAGDTYHYGDDRRKPPLPLPSQERLQELFDYNPETGELRWKVSLSNRVRVGNVAGCIDTCGHRQIRIDGVVYMAHRLIWKLINGEDPGPELDHVNGRPGENHIDNIRKTTPSQNNANQGRRANNSSGFKGVWKTLYGYRAGIQHHGIQKTLGTCPTAELAHAAYKEAALKLFGPFANFG